MKKDDFDYMPSTMTLRDYFAAQALAGILASGVGWDNPDPQPIKYSAWDAYRYADAMLKERVK